MEETFPNNEPIRKLTSPNVISTHAVGVITERSGAHITVAFVIKQKNEVTAAVTAVQRIS